MPTGSTVQRLLQVFRQTRYPADFTERDRMICDFVKPYTMTSPERVKVLVDAIKYVVRSEIDGAIVECGVWRGGSTMAAALTLKDLGNTNRDIYLYDTFSGMSAPTQADVSVDGASAHGKFLRSKTTDDASKWCLSTLEEVKRNLLRTSYPSERLHFIEGKVEHTIPRIMPRDIALLRLDTDWYESTKHELHHLFPVLKPRGVLIIDDYGHWQGARKAVDEYIAEKGLCLLLNRIDYTGRIAVKNVVV